MNFDFGWRDAITLVLSVFFLAILAMETLAVVLTCTGNWGIRKEERTSELWEFIRGVTFLSIVAAAVLLFLY